MPRVIDADELEKALGELRCGNDNAQHILTPAGMAIWEAAIDMAISTLHDEETVEAEPVVRCKDCRWVHYESADVRCCTLHKGLAMISPDSFCSYGKRRGHNATD